MLLKIFHLGKNHQKIILNIIELNEISVQDVMTPKSKIDFVDLNDDTKNNESIIQPELRLFASSRQKLF